MSGLPEYNEFLDLILKRLKVIQATFNLVEYVVIETLIKEAHTRAQSSITEIEQTYTDPRKKLCESKIAGILAYWIIKIKPIAPKINNDGEETTPCLDNIFLNEYLGVMIGINYCSPEIDKVKPIHKYFITDLVNSFSRYSYSQENLIMLFEAISERLLKDTSQAA